MLALSVLWTAPAYASGEIHVGVPEPSAIDADRRTGRVFVAAYNREPTRLW